MSDDSLPSFRPYEAYEASRAWTVIDRAISDLVDNQDLQEQAPRRYIVGYLVMQLTEAGEVAEP